MAALGFDETFRRMWSLYLAYSEAGFRTGYLDVAQLTLTKRADRGLVRLTQPVATASGPCDTCGCNRVDAPDSVGA